MMRKEVCSVLISLLDAAHVRLVVIEGDVGRRDVERAEQVGAEPSVFLEHREALWSRIVQVDDALLWRALVDEGGQALRGVAPKRAV